MSYYQDGYNKGKEDTLEGKDDIISGYFFDLLSAISNSEDQDKYEEGYGDGYKAGEEELEGNE